MSYYDEYEQWLAQHEEEPRYDVINHVPYEAEPDEESILEGRLEEPDGDAIEAHYERQVYGE